MMNKFFSAAVFAVALSSSAVAQAPAAATPEQIAEGRKHYMLVCAACHQPTGMGLAPVFPPIAKSEYVNGIPERLAAMILKGNTGPMNIQGKLYNGLMPGQEMMLTDEKIASIMTFVRASFGNSAPPVGPEVVAAARKKFAGRTAPWTEPELKAWKENGSAAADAGAPATPATPTAPAPAGTAPASPASTAPAPSQ